MTKKTDDITGFGFISVELIDPNPDQPRTRKSELDTLKASIKELGVLVPIIAVKNGERYQLIAGHRRLEACSELKHETIPSIVFDSIDRAAQVSRLMAENTVREDFTALEEVRGFQTMLDLGVDVKGVAACTGRDQALIELAKIVAPAADKLYEDLKGKQITIKEAAALVEFQDNKPNYKKLIDFAGSDNFKHVLSQLRDARDLKIKVEKVKQELFEAGVKISEESYITGAKRLPYMEVDGRRLTPEEHASCPGHIAYVNSYDGSVEYWCTTPETHGCEEEDKPSPEEIEQDNKRKAALAEWEAATKVRIEHMNAYIKGLKTLEGEALDYVAQVAQEDGIGGEGETAGLPSAQMLMEMALSQWENTVVSLIRGTGGTEIRRWERRQLPDVKKQYDFLKSIGYVLADCEQRLYDTAVAEPEHKPACGNACADPDCDECEDNPANQDSAETEEAAIVEAEEEDPGMAAVDEEPHWKDGEKE